MLVFDGAMGTGLLARQHLLTDEDYLGNPQRGPHEILGTTRPEVLEDLHASYLARGGGRAGDGYVPGQPAPAHGVGPGRAHLRDQPQRRALRPAGGGSLRDAGALASWPAPSAPAGPPSSDDPALQATFAELEESGYLQTKAFVDGGADLVIIETQIDLLETKATIFGMLRAFAETGRASPSSAR